MIHIEQKLTGEVYRRFMFEACKRCDKFSLMRSGYQYGTRVYWGKAASKALLPIRPFRLRTMEVSEWPGGGAGYDVVLRHSDNPYKYKMDVFRLCDETRDFILSKGDLFTWGYPDMAEDLCMYRGEDCWFLSCTHEQICCINTDDRSDRLLLMELGIAFGYYDNIDTFKLKL